MTISFKRKGPMFFWRVGRIGGSFYIAANASGRAPKTRKREEGVTQVAADPVPPARRAPERAQRAL